MLSRTPQFSRQKHTSEHFFYRTASNGCVQISTIFLKKEKTEQKFHSTRSSHPEVFCKKSVLKSFTKFKGKHLYCSLFFHNFGGLKPATLLKRRPQHSCFLCIFSEIFQNTFFHRTPPVAACVKSQKCDEDPVKHQQDRIFCDIFS